VDPRTEIAAVERRKAQPREGQTRFTARRSIHRAEAALRSLFAQRGKVNGEGEAPNGEALASAFAKASADTRLPAEALAEAGWPGLFET
jgi:hypothetical protein